MTFCARILYEMPRVAYFITAHGFGHAARASAIMDAVSDIHPSVSFDIFTTVPAWFFEDSLSGRFEYHDFLTDIGLVQKTPFLHHLKETIEMLNRFIPFDRELISDTANFLKQRACRLAVCDISPIGISIAAEAGIPSILIENFTWDWIYEDFIPADACFRRFADYFRGIYREVDYHIQTAPVCNPKAVDLTTGPISRKVRLPSARVREKLGISKETKMVLLTTGGVKAKYPFLKCLAFEPEICFVIPGASESYEKRDNLSLLPFRSGFMHSDLVNAADAVVGKAGYSTIAEVHQAGVPFGYVARSNFRETDRLVAFIEKEMQGIRIHDKEFKVGQWLPNVSRLLNFPRLVRPDWNGSRQVARMIKDVLRSE